MIYPHGPIEEIADNVFMVRGSIAVNRLMRISRNMGIIREGSELSLINPIRLDRDTEVKLKQLGEVSSILRLGSFHGVDDAYYVDNFVAQFWCQPGGSIYPEPNIDVELGAGVMLPFFQGELFEFQGIAEPECALLLRKEGGILFTCDAIQHYGDYSNHNLPARLMMPLLGFPRRTIVGPFWLKRLTPEGGSLEGEFRRLLELEFDKLLSAHGTFLASGAREAVTGAVDRAFA